jgi:predicted transcriptional regulator
MAALWRTEAGTVEQVRSALPARYRGAYNTVQTVLNRLHDRGLLTRKRDGLAYVYRPRLSEAEYLSKTVQSTLAGTSADVRQAVFAQLVGQMDSRELDELRELADQAKKTRRQKR